jgi:hypothetical protein
MAAVVIPIYLEEPSEMEKISLNQTLKTLHRYPIIFMTKEGLNTSWYEQYCRGKVDFSFQRFKWHGYEQFGMLMTNAAFYKPFLGYEYILICHLDAFVFHDQLEKWCKLGYDYIGSVIYNRSWDKTYSRLQRMFRATPPEYYGNGGFALKRVESFYRVLSRFKLFIDGYHWLRKIRKRHFLDDIFMAQVFPILEPGYRAAPREIAKNFGAAYEKFDEKDLPFTRHDCHSFLFGVHGWIKYHPDFWKTSIREYGYAV